MQKPAPPEPIRLDRETCGDYYYATQKEWLETNGLGGFASSTIIGAHTRRYHGLLCAPLRPPAQRFVFLSKYDEQVRIGDKLYDLATNQYPFIIHPDGHKRMASFEYDLYPRMIYDLDGVLLEKAILMPHGSNTVIVWYHLRESSQPVTLILRPLCAFRDYHSLSRETSQIRKEAEFSEHRLTIRPYDHLPPLYITAPGAFFDPKFYWYNNTEYRKEQERGLEFREDLFTHGTLSVTLEPGSALDVAASLDDTRLSSEAIWEMWTHEVHRRIKILSDFPLKDPLARRLALAADQFMVTGQSGKTIIAGYHWFTDWGRDTMISLPGLTLATGKTEDAKAIISTFLPFVSQGMIPNRFPDAGEAPEYNNVDGTLWFVMACYQYYEKTKDTEFLKHHLFDTLKDIITAHTQGTRYNIHMDDDGLLYAGDNGVQLTWMDAKIGDWVVTPRIGKPVEINALWYNALRIMAYFANQLHHDDAAKAYEAMADRIKNIFESVYWNEERRCLYDVISSSGNDRSIRPNQIFAISLPFALLSDDKALAVVRCVDAQLRTPAGLRSLAPSDSGYTGVYAGDAYHRDAAYHQGTAWLWLIGPYMEAYLRVHHFSAEARTHIRAILQTIEPLIHDAGLGTLSEIADGDAPHLPKGCIAQAWSVAEVLRIMHMLESYDAPSA
ncbi:amylo-alpha-1,6-glucosidase [bacterium]|nr:amylo-alpha-1,6-glucosidase [bacterium]